MPFRKNIIHTIEDISKMFNLKTKVVQFKDQIKIFTKIKNCWN